VWWHILEIRVTCEGGMRGLQFKPRPGKYLGRPPVERQAGMMAHAYTSAMWKAEAGRLWSMGGLSKSMRCYLKKKLKPNVLGVWLT
jgi:hypothetical protein